jgi:ribosomal protein L37AE/L43A
MCTPCQAKVAESIRALADDVEQLTELIAAGGTTQSEYVSASRELPVPIRLGVDALRRQIDVELQFWCVHVADKLGVHWDLVEQAHMRQSVRVYRATTFLADTMRELVALPSVAHPLYDDEGHPLHDKVDWQSGIDAACHLLELHQRAYRVAGRTKLVHRLTPACPWCDRKQLVRENGQDVVRCEGCKRKIPEKNYRWFVKITIAEERRLRGDGITG